MKNKVGIIILLACFILIFSSNLKAQTPSGVSRQTIEEYIAKGDEVNALGALLEALASESFPDRDWANAQYYAIAGNRGEIATATKNLEEKARENPGNMPLQLSVADGYVRLRDWNKVVEIYEKLAKQNPGDSVLSTRLRNFYMLQGNYDRVIQTYEPFVKANPDDIEASDALLNAYVRAGRANDAIELFKQRLEKNPGSAGLHGRYAQALMDFGRLDDAAKEWQKAFEIDPNNLFFKQKLAETYLALEKYPQAKKEYEELESKATDKQPWFKNTASGQLQSIEDKSGGKKQ